MKKGRRDKKKVMCFFLKKVEHFGSVFVIAGAHAIIKRDLVVCTAIAHITYFIRFYDIIQPTRLTELHFIQTSKLPR